MIRRRSSRKTILFIVGVILLIASVPVYAQPTQGQAFPPPIAAPLIREGELALKLLPALGLGLASDEITAESRLGDAGIMPRNGWIADYPVTPDIVGELQRAVSDAADAGMLNMSREQALGQMSYIASGLNVSSLPYTDGQYASQTPDAWYYPEPAALNNYYYNEGPPVYTYFVPPDDYYNLYTYVAYPFASSGYWFPGFFILRDFHRTIRVHGRPYYCSNHFRTPGSQRVAVVDPVARLGQAGASSVGVPYAGSHAVTGSQGGARGGALHPRARGLHGAAGPSYQMNNTNTVATYRTPIPSYHGVVTAPQSYARATAATPYPGAGPAPVSYRGGSFGPVYHGGTGFSSRAATLSGPSGGAGRTGGLQARGGGHR